MTQQIKNSRILIIGGAGFIGCNLVAKFLAQDNEVICLDNFSTGKRTNIERFLEDPAFTFVEGDIRDRKICEQAVSDVDFVLHDAALGSVPRSIKDPISSTEVNVVGFVNMLYAAKEAKVKRFVYAASSSAYGDSHFLPKIEGRIGKPLSPYAITKLTNELFAENFSAIYGIETIGLRYFNVYGRYQNPFGDYAAVIPKFVTKLIRHERPQIYGDGNNSRDFTYIDDVLQANELALLTTDRKALNTVFNIAYGGRTTLNELFVHMRDNLSLFDPAIAVIEPEYGPEREGDVPHSLANTDKARELLGYMPRFDIEAGLKQATEWYFENLK